jgi:hypothetical protein
MFAMPLAEEPLFEGCRPSAGGGVFDACLPRQCCAVRCGNVGLLSGGNRFPSEDDLRGRLMRFQTNDARRLQLR